MTIPPGIVTVLVSLAMVAVPAAVVGAVYLIHLAASMRDAAVEDREVDW